MAPKGSKAPKARPKPPDPPKEYPTIADELLAAYQESRPYQTLAASKGIQNLTANEKACYAHAVFLETGAWRSWPAATQNEFWKTIQSEKIPIPLPKPQDLGRDTRGIEVGKYTPAEFKLYLRREREIEGLLGKTMGYLRAIMAAKEHSPRVLELTEHIISMNAAHYTVWLYRSQTLLALNSSIPAELEWVNNVALDNQKNYQIWHHRQILVEHLVQDVGSDEGKLRELGKSEVAFMKEMFDEDAKNYHVWSYRQWLVRKLDLWQKGEIEDCERLLREDVRNNSAWAHRFFVVFSNPRYCTEGSKATEFDGGIPDEILDREIEFSKAACFEAPQNQSPWNYLRGVLKKGGRKLVSLECFAGEFVKIPEKEGEGEEDVKSSHALDFLADAWAEKGEREKADRALRLLGDKYDRIRKNYWDWRRALLKSDGGGLGGIEGQFVVGAKLFGH
ncbi:related to geranylgeranyltransferase type I alpha subunit (RAM2) [Phialocephala subalpina]|uniref:Protein farnesyltransferase/geranylgeranyltransferase type-1 subunit alpha n=1 Tax=Phialocephala subalpina TaxID=576137 RepID=A0A1L7WYR2_9HELO|nr:related to geranylgeranyltransferase type I alpha subunit (RAM2) [Phialocephala subalpina]